MYLSQVAIHQMLFKQRSEMKNVISIVTMVAGLGMLLCLCHQGWGEGGLAPAKLD